jgi:hypothetical protein
MGYPVTLQGRVVRDARFALALCLRPRQVGRYLPMSLSYSDHHHDVQSMT